MTANEAIKRIKTMHFMCDDFHNCKYGHDCTDGCSEAVKMAVDALQGSVKKKHIGSDNMVISSSDLMTILNTDNEKEIRAKAIDEFSELIKERIVGMQMSELQGEDVCPCRETGEECQYMNQDIGCQYCAREQTIKDIDEIAEQLKGGV